MSLINQLTYLAIVAAAMLVPVSSTTAGNDDLPNIIFILADDLGYGDLGCYGQKQIKTPRIDALAEGGMRFTNFYSGSTVCAPSRCCLMTGYHTGHAYIRGNGRESLRPEDVTVADLLTDAGYITALCGKWGLGEEGSTGVPNRKGFEYFYGYLNQRHAHNFYPTYLIENESRVELKNVVPDEDKFGAGVASEKVQYSHDLIIDKAVEFIKEYKDNEFFLYLSLTIPHANNEAKEKGMEVPDWGAYADLDWPEPQKGHAAMITRMDSSIGQIVDLLEELGIRENTIIFFTSDNGPHREGGNKPEFNDSNGPLRGIKRSLHEGGIRVPMIVNWPGKIEANSTSDHIGAFWDVMPTLMDLAGEEITHSGDLDGISFTDELSGKSHLQAKHDFLYWGFFEKETGRAIRQGKWKLIQQPFLSDARLYNLELDEGEIQDVSENHPEITKKLTRLMDRSHTHSEKWQFPAVTDQGDN